MTDKAVSEILSRWDTMMGKFMEISPKVYGFYLRQAILVDGIMGVIACVVFLVLAWKGVLWIIRRPCSDSDDGFLRFIGLGICGIVILAAALNLVDSIGHIINPNYYAIRSIIETLKLK